MGDSRQGTRPTRRDAGPARTAAAEQKRQICAFVRSVWPEIVWPTKRTRGPTKGLCVTADALSAREWDANLRDADGWYAAICGGPLPRTADEWYAEIRGTVCALIPEEGLDATLARYARLVRSMREWPVTPGSIAPKPPRTRPPARRRYAAPPPYNAHDGKWILRENLVRDAAEAKRLRTEAAPSRRQYMAKSGDWGVDRVGRIFRRTPTGRVAYFVASLLPHERTRALT